MIEVEIRSFISKKQYEHLISHFKQHAKFLGEDHQETIYYDAPVDVRIQKNDTYAKVWLKKGKIHEDAREEIEIKVGKEDFDKLHQLFSSLGYAVAIKWLRTRNTFLWNDVTVTIDDTAGYGCIIELEKLSTPEETEETLKQLQYRFAELRIPITPKEEFEKKFLWYKGHWREIVQ